MRFPGERTPCIGFSYRLAHKLTLLPNRIEAAGLLKSKESPESWTIVRQADPTDPYD